MPKSAEASCENARVLDWNDLRYLLAFQQSGSVTRAARKLQVDHSTVLRRLSALEQALGTRLFNRTPTGYALTAEAEALLGTVKGIEESILSLERGLGGHDTRLEGTVRLTLSEALGSRFLAPRLGPFHERHPGIDLQCITSNVSLDLSRREADLALRLVRPVQEQLITRKVGEMGTGLYAAREYLARRGRPRDVTDLSGHELIAYDESLASTPETRWMEKAGARGRFVLRANSTAMLVGATVAGLGLAMLPCFLADLEPSLERLPLPEELTPRAIWLVVHRDLQHAARVRAVSGFLSEVLAREAPLLRGDPRPKRRLKG